MSMLWEKLLLTLRFARAASVAAAFVGLAYTVQLYFSSNQLQPHIFLEPSPDMDERNDCTECVDCPVSPVIADVITNMRKLQEWEAEISTDLHVIRNKLVNPKMITSMLVGSVVDGSSLAKWFNPDAEVRELEVDMQHTGAAFDESHLPLFESLADDKKPDNLRVRVPSAQVLNLVLHYKFWELLVREEKLLPENSKDTDCRHNFFNLEYFHPQVMRKILHHLLAHRDPKHKDALALVSLLFGVDITESINVLPERGTALTTTLKINHRKTGQVIKLSIDHVGAFICSFWPEVAKDFTQDTLCTIPRNPPRAGRIRKCAGRSWRADVTWCRSRRTAVTSTRSSGGRLRGRRAR